VDHGIYFPRITLQKGATAGIIAWVTRVKLGL